MSQETEISSSCSESIHIARSAANSEEQEPLLGATGTGADEDWAVDKIASGQELSDYIPLSNTVSSEVIRPSGDVSVATDLMQPPVDNNKKDQNDLPDPLAELGVCGLRNIGNTCYMNASLQCLRSVPSLMSHCLSSDPVTPLEKEEDPSRLDKSVTCRTHIHTTFTSLVKKLWSGQFSSVRPRLLKTTLGLLHPQFSGSRQHDSQEFLAMLLDNLHEHCSTDSSSVINDTFQGELRNEVVCAECGNMSVKMEPFVFLSLPLPGAYDIIVELNFVSTEYPPTVTRLAVKVCRYSSVVEDVKRALRVLLGREVSSELLVLAEVLDGTVVRTLADSLPMDRLNSKRGEKLFMFEMIPAQNLMASLRAPDTSTDGLSLSAEVAMDTDAPTAVPMETAVVMMEWHSCDICLEEMVDSDLLTHAQCGGTLCSNCLKASKAHQESIDQKRITCPICSKPFSEESNFKPMTGESGASSGDNAISLLLMTVLYRSSEVLVGHPLLRHLPTRAQGAVFHREIAKSLPPEPSNLPFTLKLTDDKGRCCSRCDFTTKCSGCVVSNDESSCDLKPGDHLTVEFTSPLSAEQLKKIRVVEEHSSVSLLETRQLTLNDCLNSFAQRETLSQENSWFCPKCECQRLAEHTLSVNKVPQTLIVHLKRFIYHGREGSKVEGGVAFPLELSGVSKNDSTTLQLTACICHTGTLHFGHYTAYCKHPCTGDWVYYNDSSSTKVDKPDCQDAVYMLFYQKPIAAPTVETAKEEFDDSTERAATETLLRLFKPVVPTAPLPPPLPLKRSSSNPDLSKPEDAIPAVKLLRMTACPW